jgi:copper chaperone CopZ
MTKSYRLKNLGCANCAAKMERGISKISGVRSAAISFMTAKLTIEAEEADFPRISEEARNIIRKYEPDVMMTAV